MIYILSHNVIKSKKQTRYFMLAVILTLIIVILEAATAIFTYYTSITTPFTLYCINGAGFLLSPLVPIAMTVMIKQEITYKKYILLLLLLNTFLVLASFFSGALFSISEIGIYQRGALFFFFPIVLLCTFIIFMYENYRNSKDFDMVDRIYLYGLYIIVVVGCVVQMIFDFLILMWSCISVSLFLYYVFVREIELKYDALTNLRNRRCFNNKMRELESKNNVWILVFDINDLKRINDTDGHIAGDQHILKVVHLLKEYVKNLGILYRIGGDEFCVLCENIEKDQIDIFLKKLYQRLEQIMKQNQDSLFYVAYGHAIYNVGEEFTIYDRFSLADKMMYQNKREMKSQQCCTINTEQ